MKDEVKQDIFRIFYVASFLFITIFFILPYLVQVSTFFHERGHQKALDRYDVENAYYFNLLETIPNFFNPKVTKLGVTRFDLDAYEALNNQFINLGINMEAIHRISAMSAGTLDSLPHCGAVITLLVVAGLTHADSYKDIFIVSVIVPLIAVFFVVVPLCMVIY